MPATRFAHRLALMLGEPDVDGMLENMSGEQFNRWYEYFTIEPFGPRQEEHRAGKLCALMFNAWYKDGHAKESDFFPALADPNEVEQDDSQDPMVLNAMMRAWVLASGGKVIENDG